MGMRLAQVAVWVRDLEAARAFYERYFEARASEKYINQGKRFESYFLTLAGGGQIELMRRPEVRDDGQASERLGYAHVGIEVESNAAVDEVTNHICRDRSDALVDGPRRTGDGYYESIVRDSEGNRILIVSAER
jgi:lactoylglutathione lyase